MNTFKMVLLTKKADYYIYIYLVIALLFSFVLGKDILLFGNLVVVFGILSFIFIKQEKLLLYATILISLFHEGISFLINGTYLVMYMYILMIVSLLIKKKKIVVDKPILVAGIFALLISLSPLIIKGISIPLLFFSILKRFGFLIVYFFAININNLNEKNKKFLTKLFILILIVNFIISFFQFIKGTLHQDFITGLFGGGMTGILIYLFMFYISLLSGLHFNKKISNISYLFLTLIPIIYSAIAEVKIGFITTTILIVIYLTIINKSLKSLIYIFILGIFSINLYLIFVKIYPTHAFLNYDFLNNYLVEQSYGDGTINRIGYKSQVDLLIFENSTDELFGRGLGSANPSELEFLQGELYGPFDYLKLRWFTLPYLYVESGVLGSAFFLIVYFVSLVRAVRIYSKNKTWIAISVILMSLTNIIYLPYNSGLLDYGITSVYWIFVGILFKEGKAFFNPKIEGIT